MAVACDIREPDQVESMVAAVLERFGSIDVLVANAGGQFSAAAEEISGRGWRAVERLNLDGNWDLTSRVAREAMIPARSGLIVFVGFSPRRGIPGFAHACATRAALENLASTLALEWSRFGIRSVCLSCGPIDTEGLASYGPESLEESRRTVPLGRLGTEDEVGATVAFLASPGGAFITGTTILVDGGVDAWGLAEPPPAPER
jgi:citronellol/citronellal dehydrogenase